MAIRGRLEDLQASEILQFLAQSGRSGTLRFADDHKSKLLCLEGGKLVYAVSQHKLPPLGEVLYQHGIISDVIVKGPESIRSWSDQMTKALSWRRMSAGSTIDGEHSYARLGQILARRGKVTWEELDYALEPSNMPDHILEEILVTGYGIGRTAVQGIRKIATPDVSLYQALISAQALTREQIEEAVAGIGDDKLGDLLVYFGYVKKSEVAFSAEQLEAMRSYCPPVFRIGEVLVASGRATQRQLEKALEAQLTDHKLLGEILVDHGVLREEHRDDAVWELHDLRATFSPLHRLSEILTRAHGLTIEEFNEARHAHLESGQTLATELIEAQRITESTLREVFENVLSDELCDLMFWQEGSYEFFEGFSLEDAVAQEGLDSLHDYVFETGSLLLDAAYHTDELRRSDPPFVYPETILEKQDVFDLEDEGLTIPEADLRLLDRMDGKRPRMRVCAVLPGNSLSHGRLMMHFIANGWARALTRTEAFNKGQACVDRRNFEQAIVYYEHALLSSGDQPTDSALRVAIQDARVAVTRNHVRHAALAITKAARFVGNLQIVQVPLKALSRVESLARPARWLREKWSILRGVVSQKVNQWTLAFEEFMIQKGLARQWWAIRTRFLAPLKRISGDRRVATTVMACVMVSLILGTAGLATFGEPERAATLGGLGIPGYPPAEVKSAIAELEAGGPFDVSPAVTNSAIYMVSRDGTLRSLPLARLSDKSKFRWEVEVGRYGDLLSSPVVFGKTVFLTNVRGSVHALSTDGTKLWTKKFPRMERIEPSVIVEGKPVLKAVGLVVVGREVAYVLDPKNGQVLYELQTGNMVIAPPAASKERIYVGGVDNHIYCADWRAGEIVWDVEVADDVMSLSLVGEHLVALVRGVAVVALNTADGSVLWKKKFDGKPVRRVEVLTGKRISVELDRGELRICSLETGDDINSIMPKAVLGVTSMRVVRDKFIYVSRRGYIGQLNGNGAHLWSCEKDLGRITGWTLVKSRLAVTNQDGKLWFFDLLRQGQ